jgi:peptide deformylase
MAILKIARMGHPILKQRAAEVADPAAPAIRRLVVDMLDTMRDAEGAGLAAPQVHVPLRVVIFHVPAARAAAEEGGGEDEASAARGLTVLVNPVIEPLTEETALGMEGCLSVPGLRGMVPRFTRIRYRGVTPEGESIDRVAAGFHARVVQHECDHLDGMLYPQRMTDLGTLMFTTELKHWIEDADSDPDAGEEDA